MNQPDLTGLPIYLDDPNEEAELLEEFARETADEIMDAILDAFPGWQIPPMSKLPARERLARYMQATLVNDLPLLRDPDYVKKYQAGEAPAVQSPFWLNLLSLPPVFKTVQQDFRRVTADEVRKVQGGGEEPQEREPVVEQQQTVRRY